MSTIPTIGEFNKVTKWERVNKYPDNTAGQEEQYVDWFTARMCLRKMSESRKLNLGYDEMGDVYEGWIQWRHAIEADITKDARVVFDNRFFAVRNYDLVDDKRRLYKVTLTTVT